MVQLSRLEVGRASPRSASSRRTRIIGLASSFFAGLGFGAIPGPLPWATGRGGPNSTITLFMQPAGAKQIAHPANDLSYAPPPVSVRCKRLAAGGPVPVLAAFSRCPRGTITAAAGPPFRSQDHADAVVQSLEEIGIDRETALNLERSTKYRLQYVDVTERFALLKAAGFDHKTARHMVKLNPFILTFSDVKTRIGLLETKGFDYETAMRMTRIHPQILGYDVEKQIASLTGAGFGFDRDSVVKMVRDFPQLLGYNVDTIVRPKLDFLKSEGIDIADIVSYPRCLSYSLEGRMQPRLKRLKQRGSSPQTCEELMAYLKLKDEDFDRKYTLREISALM